MQIGKTIKRAGLESRSELVAFLENLHDVIMSRSGSIVVGQALSGKTRSLRLIQEAYEQLYQEELEQRKEAFHRRKSEVLEATSAGLSLDLMNTRGAGTLDIMDVLQGEQQPNALDLRPEEQVLIRRSCRSKRIVTHIVNPQAQPASAFMGEIEEKTKEFKDGILASTLRQIVSSDDGKYQWIVFDGEVATEWIEVLNSVLDDNKKLTLVSGEALPLTPTTRIVIECTDLSKCSPAIISRCGILNMADSVASPK